MDDRELSPREPPWILFKMDAARWVDPQQFADVSTLTPRVILRLLFQHRGLRAMAWFRLAGWVKSRGIKGVPTLIEHHMTTVYGLEIGPLDRVGGGCYIAHPQACVLHVKAIGRDVSIIAGITVGMRGSYVGPVIGDRVFLGAGCRVLGELTLGDGCRIGANSVVLDDVPPGTTAVGSPARILTESRGRV